MPTTQPLPLEEIEAIKPLPWEEVQFSDGAIGFLYRTPGLRLEWGDNIYTDVEHGLGIAVVKMNDGSRTAIGSGTAVVLPSLDTRTGMFASEASTMAGLLENIAPGGLTPITIGKPWQSWPIPGLLVESVMFSYTSTTPGIEGLEQVAMPSYFPGVKELLNEWQNALKT